MESTPAMKLDAPASPAPSASVWTNGKASAQALRAAQARQQSGRRRLVDPATCDRDYSTAEVEFMLAMQEYKKKSGRNFPTWSEVLEVLQALGYHKAEDDAADRIDMRRDAAVS
jgi:hypothetical protein